MPCTNAHQLTMQLSLAGVDPGDSGEANENTKSGSSGGLRDYQERISCQALSLLEQRKSVLTVAATGTGKTRIGAAVVKSYPGRVLWFAHRYELVQQAREALERYCGEQVGVELPGVYSSNHRVVVASKDTVRTKARLNRLKNFGQFDLLVIDECHHSEARTYRSICNAYPSALRYGLTATPLRMDKRGLSLFDVATESLGITQALERGWLVPVVAERLGIVSVDLSGVRTVRGDLDQQQLSEVMRSEANLHAVAKAILDRQADWPGLLFSPAVDVAERTSEIINRYRPGTARFVSGKTPDNERRELFANLGKTYQVLANYGIATEGTDLVQVRSVFMQRPTKSTALFQQMLGRGLRPLPGIVDAVGTDTGRIAAIKASQKARCLVVDFTGNTGRHSIATAVDVLAAGQDLPGQVLERVRERLAKGDQLDIAGAIADEIKAKQDRDRAKAVRDLGRLRRAAIVGTVQLTARDIRLIGLGGEPTGPGGNGTGHVFESVFAGPPLPAQTEELNRLGISTRFETAGEARKAIAEARDRRRLATAKQIAFIAKHKPDLARPDLEKTKASYIIGRIVQRWK